jgi:hypothetical protein
MADHVDVVRIDWGKGTQTRVAQVCVGLDDIKIEGDYEDVVRRPYTDRQSGQRLDPTTSPEQFVARLHTVMGGSHLVATELHSDEACAFHDAETLDLEPVKPSDSSHTRARWIAARRH